MRDMVEYNHYGKKVSLPICEIERAEKNHNKFSSNLCITYVDGSEVSASGCHDFIEMMYVTAVAISDAYVLGYKQGYGKAAEKELHHLKRLSYEKS